MNNLLEYNGYFGSINVSIEDGVIHGKLLYINDLVTFEADNVADLEKAFAEAVDDYLDYCKQKGKEPEKPYKGSFNVRITPENHKKAVMQATKRGLTLNQFVEKAIISEINSSSTTEEHLAMNGKIDSLTTTVQSLNNNFVSDYMFRYPILKEVQGE